MPTLPSLFVSHGAPNLILGSTAARGFLSGLAEELPKQPQAIVMISAHWETASPAVSAPLVNDTIHDFGGFERELYALRYPAPGSPATAERIAALLQSAALPVTIDGQRGLDHGAWVPLMLAWPDADIPVVQLSVQTQAGVDHHLAIGEALEPLRNEGVLIIGSGSFTHDLRSYLPHRHNTVAPEPDWVSGFADWMDAALASNDRDALRSYRKLAPDAVRNHPTEEHLLPLFVALGAGGTESSARALHRSTTHGVLRMDAYAFGN
ncbi:class III extradiol ring-cleavage dioxygenase [Blastomonas sp.]|uniref:DODA-type extradiol aromatic ring-opening family dioxygenase n=1 Tax=Blastomonas sp. TaxID=1909299 RepID=UPI0035940B7B